MPVAIAAPQWRHLISLTLPSGAPPLKISLGCAVPQPVPYGIRPFLPRTGGSSATAVDAIPRQDARLINA